MNNTVLFLVLALSAASNLYATEAESLFNKSCTMCHGPEVFTRTDRKVKDMAGLKNRIRQCGYMAEAGWFDDEIDAVADYLNKNYYGF